MGNCFGKKKGIIENLNSIPEGGGAIKKESSKSILRHPMEGSRSGYRSNLTGSVVWFPSLAPSTHSQALLDPKRARSSKNGNLPGRKSIEKIPSIGNEENQSYSQQTFTTLVPIPKPTSDPFIDVGQILQLPSEPLEDNYADGDAKIKPLKPVEKRRRQGKGKIRRKNGKKVLKKGGKAPKERRRSTFGSTGGVDDREHGWYNHPSVRRRVEFENQSPCRRRGCPCKEQCAEGCSEGSRFCRYNNEC